MTTETKRRIRAYKKALPELRERVIAVALLLAMSVSMLASASFAWLTISRNPEVSAVSTTITANGNLEIALANGVDAPAESKVGDSSATQGQSITAANITWGNLINLSDPSYGLDNLVLRPAQLNKDALQTNPLYGAVFTADGRVEKLSSNFSYTAWVPPSEDGKVPGYFGVSNNLGVRAISSTKMELVGFMGEVMTYRNNADTTNALARGRYLGITTNDAWMKTLASLMGIHMTASLNYEDEFVNAEVKPEELKNLIEMYEALLDVYTIEASAIATTLNMELYLAYGGDTSRYNAYDADSVLGITQFATKANGSVKVGDFVAAEVASDSGEVKVVKVTNLKSFINDYKMVAADKAKMEEIDQSGDRRWTASGLKKLVEHLVNIDTCLIKFDGESEKTVQALMTQFESNVTSAMGYMNKSCTATITNGMLYNLDQRVGAGIVVNDGNGGGLPITATVKIASLGGYSPSATLYATIKTSASTPCDFVQDLRYADTLNTGADSSMGEATAEDTYGLAIDFWIRTNAASSYLTLEGTVLVEENEVPDMGKDFNGNEVRLYTWTERTTGTDDNGDSIEVSTTHTIYQVEIPASTDEVTGETTPATVAWYKAETHSRIAVPEDENPIPKMKIETTVIGYEGENRIWNSDEDKTKVSADATTQGTGSCYIFYADTPEDQERSKELLKAMHVAFVDGNGNLLAEAEMDTNQIFEESGRLIVPLVMSEKSISLGSGDNVIRAITPLAQNVATRITAIVYLDGTQLTNDHVLSAADIQGQLNIQFGSSNLMEPIRNETLELSERKVSASVTNRSFNFDTDNDLSTNVEIMVTGDQPQHVRAFFIRKINDSQGSRERMMDEFVYDAASGKWVGTYTFTAPGTYILRTVELDGQEYALPSDEASIQANTVNIEGFTIANLTCTDAEAGNKINIMTAAASDSVDLTLQFASNDVAKMPRSVQGRFLRSDGTAVNVNFVYNATTAQWKGTATFLASGDYVFKYLVLDGQYTELPETMWHTAVVKLGMRVAVYTTGNTIFQYLPSSMKDNEKLLPMQVKIMDNSGAELPGLTGAQLYYRLETSSVTTLHTSLTWNGTYYVGEFKTIETEESGNTAGPGVWIFKNVIVGNNTINDATTAPVFSIMSPEPPSFVGFANGAATQFKPNGDGALYAELKYSSTAKIQATVVHTSPSGAQTTHQILATNPTAGQGENDTKWKFALPEGNKDGYWQITKLHIWNYFDDEGVMQGAEVGEDGKLIGEAPMVINVSQKPGSTVRFIQTIQVSFAGNQNRDLQGAFLESKAISDVFVKIADYAGQPLGDVTAVKLTYNYDGNSAEYGGYTGAAAKDGIFALDFEVDPTDGTKFLQKGERSVQFAGVYTPVKLEFMVAGQHQFTYTGETTPVLPTGAPTITLTSSSPTLKVTALSTEPGTNVTVLTGTRASDGTVNYETDATGDFFWFSDYYAVVYLTVNPDWRLTSYAPEVELTLSGMPESNFSASVVFNNASSSEHNATYTFTQSNLVQSNTIGYEEDGGTYVIETWSPKLFPAGKQTVSSLAVTYGDYNLTVALSNPVTINQPQYPPYVSFVVNDDVLDTPTRVFGTPLTDGTFVTTLPTVESRDKNMSQSLSTLPTDLSTVTPSTTTSKYAQYSGGMINGTWTKYDVTTKVYTVTTESRTWKERHQLVGWRYTGGQPKPGDTITFSSNTTMTAMIDTSYTHSENMETVTYKRTVITIVTSSESGKSYSRPSGYTNAEPPSAGDSGWVAQN